MPNRHHIIFLTAIALLAAAASGCKSTSDLAINTYESARGTTYGLIEAEPEETLDAVKAATAELNVTIYEVTPTQDPLGYGIEAEEEDGRNITITIRQYAPGVTRLSVRAGFLGDDKKNDVLYERIAQRLGLEPKATK